MVGFGRGAGLAYHTALYLDAQLVLALIAGVIGSTPFLPLLASFRNEVRLPAPGRIRTLLKNGLALAELASLSLLFLA